MKAWTFPQVRASEEMPPVLPSGDVVERNTTVPLNIPLKLKRAQEDPGISVNSWLLGRAERPESWPGRLSQEFSLCHSFSLVEDTWDC